MDCNAFAAFPIGPQVPADSPVQYWACDSHIRAERAGEALLIAGASLIRHAALLLPWLPRDLDASRYDGRGKEEGILGTSQESSAGLG
ncbi:hypothetical protein AAFF_G00191400 [Aldrovandia affinis]|uniref:Uncharacterized protein n=1 Tax=Aldrovandia affinis TaxID=143900 RepID=A0AAD7RJE7_9TELE|nr:hypothetical protein AAFF_G00191400 [Aldrovandia affinis]